jgi:peroxiredoxin (alkyl hydroperoxide reductase subunit C)
MTEIAPPRLGGPAPDFTMDIYDPKTDDFGQVSLEELKKKGKWTILFFYPADFTFV